MHFLQSYGETSIGAFYTEDVVLDKAEASHPSDYVISARCWLAPYDLGISQDVRFEAEPTGEHGVYAIDVIICGSTSAPACTRSIKLGQGCSIPSHASI